MKKKRTINVKDVSSEQLGFDAMVAMEELWNRAQKKGAKHNEARVMFTAAAAFLTERGITEVLLGHGMAAVIASELRDERMYGTGVAA